MGASHCVDGLVDGHGVVRIECRRSVWEGSCLCMHESRPSLLCALAASADAAETQRWQVVNANDVKVGSRAGDAHRRRIGS